MHQALTMKYSLALPNEHDSIKKIHFFLEYQLRAIDIVMPIS